MANLHRVFDVLVVGGGNAGLCGAIAARAAGASVLMLEGAPASHVLRFRTVGRRRGPHTIRSTGR